ncbi:unnamed protein product [Amoebophrya sp. A25]|nr:unnamed protein product [Amoebophrya sp. A25]|eukprot:GSA25T00015219001.1
MPRLKKLVVAISPATLIHEIQTTSGKRTPADTSTVVSSISERDAAVFDHDQQRLQTTAKGDIVSEDGDKQPVDSDENAATETHQKEGARLGASGRSISDEYDDGHRGDSSFRSTRDPHQDDVVAQRSTRRHDPSSSEARSTSSSSRSGDQQTRRHRKRSQMSSASSRRISSKMIEHDQEQETVDTTSSSTPLGVQTTPGASEQLLELGVRSSSRASGESAASHVQATTSKSVVTAPDPTHFLKSSSTFAFLFGYLATLGFFGMVKGYNERETENQRIKQQNLEIEEEGLNARLVYISNDGDRDRSGNSTHAASTSRDAAPQPKARLKR